jgi:hypothetical protein
LQVIKICLASKNYKNRYLPVSIGYKGISSQVTEKPADVQRRLENNQTRKLNFPRKTNNLQGLASGLATEVFGLAPPMKEETREPRLGIGGGGGGMKCSPPPVPNCTGTTVEAEADFRMVFLAC